MESKLTLTLLTLTGLMLFAAPFSYGQGEPSQKDKGIKNKANKIEIKFDAKNETISKKDSSIQTLSKNKKYYFVVTGAHPAIYDFIARTEAYDYFQDTPEALKAIFPYNPDEFLQDLIETVNKTEKSGKKLSPEMLDSLKRSNNSKLPKLYDTVYNTAEKHYTTLTKRIDKGNQLYSKLKEDPNFTSLPAPEFDEIKDEIIYNHQYIVMAEQLFKNYINNKAANIDSAALNKYAKLATLKTDLELRKKNFNKVLRLYERYEAADSVKNLKGKPFTVSGDIIKTDFVIIDTYKSDTVIINQSLEYPTKGGKFFERLNFDFTSGFAIDGIVQDQHYLQAVEGDESRKEVIEEKSAFVNSSFVALGHLNYQFNTHFKAGPALGAGVSLYDKKVRYLMGISGIFGTKNQFAVTIGGAFAQVDELSASVESGAEDDKRYVPASTESIPYYKAINSCLFFSLTYNVSKLVKKK